MIGHAKTRMPPGKAADQGRARPGLPMFALPSRTARLAGEQRVSDLQKIQPRAANQKPWSEDQGFDLPLRGIAELWVRITTATNCR